jgi:phosphatidylserine/phosphatidylglycerophosphate/cardiolipin synthase-like enzyme
VKKQDVRVDGELAELKRHPPREDWRTVMADSGAEKLFTGIVRIRAGRSFLSSGGLEAELLPASGLAPSFTAHDGRLARVMGRQVGGAIENARLVSEPEAETALGFEPVLAVLAAEGKQLGTQPGVVSVRPGYRRVAGRITDEPAIVVSVLPSRSVEKAETARVLPRTLGGIPVDVVPADPRETRATKEERLTAWQQVHASGPASAAAESIRIGYKPPPPERVTLEACELRDVLCHVGPDAGWSTLRSFLAGTKSRLTVAMYELTAEHVARALAELGRDSQAQLELILQENDNEASTVQALKRAWQGRFTYARAVVSGPQQLFATSYHTKVAVRDGTTTWLSSGNWSPHSQPEIPDGETSNLYRHGNREWHVVVKDKELAKIFEEFIRWDREQAAAVAGVEAAPVLPDLLVPERAFLELEAAVFQPRPFTPKRIRRAASEQGIPVQPLLTPDNYGPRILELIDSAQDSLYMQYSYVRAPKSADLYRELVKADGRKMRQGVDVRVIVDGRNQASADTDTVLSLGWDRSRWRLQKSRVHNKGIIVDRRYTVVGSQNWSVPGTQANRDASLIFDAEDVAAYYGDVFDFDWSNLTKPIETPEITPIIAEPGARIPVGMVRIPWRAWYSE